MVVASGVPLRVGLEDRVVIKRVGEPIYGRLVDSIYIFDRVAVPAGSVVEGHIAEIGGVPASRRLRAILSGNFTPPRDVRAQFDTLVLSDGSRLPLHSSLSRGTAHTVRVAARGKRTDQPATENRAVLLAFTAPGKMSQLKSYLAGMFPYHRQTWTAGTLFNSALQDPLTGLPPSRAETQSDHPAADQSGEMEVEARLLAPLSSATVRRGALVEAIVTRPLFSTSHALLIPEGSRLRGDVVDARPARWLHRNGKLLFVFRQLQLPAQDARSIQGRLEGVDASFDAHLAIDAEGAAHASSPKTRFIFPAISAAVAGLSFHQDYNSQGVPDQDIGGRAESGAVGLGLIGTVVAQAARPLASGIAVAGAAFSIYSTFIARGEEVVLPANTPVRVSLGTRGGLPSTR